MKQKGFWPILIFFKFYRIRFKEGDPKTALQEPNSVVIKEDIAQKTFW